MTDREDRNRRAVSIEELLVWAYRDQMVDRARVKPVELGHKSSGPLAAWSPLWTEGAPVEASRKSGFDAADDAWAVHRLVEGLKRVTVDGGHHVRAWRYHSLGQYRGADPPIGGGAVDKTARGPASLRPWPTHGMLEINAPLLVMTHATKATRPDNGLAPDVRFKAGPVVRHSTQKGGVYTRGLFCHVQAEGVLPGEAVEAFEMYRAWHGALASLSVALRAVRLVMFNVTDTLPPPPKKPGWGLD